MEEEHLVFGADQGATHDSPSSTNANGRGRGAATPPQYSAQPETEHSPLHATDTHGVDAGGVGAPSLGTSEGAGDDRSFLEITTSIIESDGPRIEAFAKLEFGDGQFYMNTYAVELGRDIRAARRAFQQDLQAGQDPEQHLSTKDQHRSNSSGDVAPGRLKLSSEEHKKTASSVLSESGGILNYDPYDSDSLKRAKGRRTKSEGSYSQTVSRKDSTSYFGRYQNRPSSFESPTKRTAHGAQPINPTALMPSPDECPLIPIHPPTVTDGTNAGHRGISRRHVRIAYNFERRLFEMEVRGRNGAFVDDLFFPPGEITELRNGSYIQIGGVGIRFILPDVAHGETGAEGTRGSEAQSAMSFDFEDGRGQGIAMPNTSESDSGEADENVDDSSQDSSIQGLDGRGVSHDVDEGRSGSDTFSSEEDEEENSRHKKSQPLRKASRQMSKSATQQALSRRRLKMKTKGEPKATKVKKKDDNGLDDKSAQAFEEEALKALGLDIPLSMIPPRRKGPGRPPKNGFMSKREEASLKKQAREAAKASDGIKNSDAIKDSLSMAVLEKRKYTKRKKLDDPSDATDIRESIEVPDTSTPSQAPENSTLKPLKEKRTKPPKSPSPFIDEALLTPEQLAKPQQSYVVLIHEALTNSRTGQMSLPQIYRAIERRYPYFKFKVQTVGWQSSIRHNLSQHPAFRKVEREGKGWMWGLVPEVSIEKEKRPRRPSPPTVSHGNYYPHSQNMLRPPYPYQAIVEPTINGTSTGQGQFAYPPFAGSSIRPPQVMRGPGGLTLPISQDNSSSTYQSPYTSAPQANDAQGSEQSVQNPRTDNGNISQLSANNWNSQVPAPGRHIKPEPQVDTSLQKSQDRTLPPQRADVHPLLTTAPSASLTSERFSRNTLDAVDRFKAIMIELLPNNPHAEEIVTGAINRTLGIHQTETQSKEYPEQKAIMEALQTLLNQIRATERWGTEQQEENQKAMQTSPQPLSNSHDPDIKTQPPEPTNENRSQEPPKHANQPAENSNKTTPISQPQTEETSEHSNSPIVRHSPSRITSHSAESHPPTLVNPTTSTGTLPRPTSNPLPQVEQDHLHSLLQQLDQNSAFETLSPMHGGKSVGHNESDSQARKATVEANHAVKRKRDDYGDTRNSDTPLPNHTDPVEESRAKRVAV